MHLNSYPTTRTALLLSLQPSSIFEGGGCAIFAKRELYVACTMAGEKAMDAHAQHLMPTVDVGESLTVMRVTRHVRELTTRLSEPTYQQGPVRCG
jgi:hypothetical protein